jgi:hypothetical protein
LFALIFFRRRSSKADTASFSFFTGIFFIDE